MFTVAGAQAGKYYNHHGRPLLRERVSKIMVVHSVGQNHKHMAKLLILIVSEKPSCGSIYVKREKKQKQL